MHDKTYHVRMDSVGEKMKIKIDKTTHEHELEILITAYEEDPELEKVTSLLQDFSVQLTGKKDGRTYLFSIDDVYYIESIEDGCFLYTKNDVFDCKYKLYEVEAIHASFIRINKNTVLNYQKIKHFTSTYNSRLEATLTNKDRLEISRRYVKELKEKLGAKPHEKV